MYFLLFLVVQKSLCIFKFYLWSKIPYVFLTFSLWSSSSSPVVNLVIYHHSKYIIIQKELLMLLSHTRCDTKIGY